MNVKEILKITKGTLVYGEETVECEQFSKDTRTLKPKDVYIGIPGEKVDGNTFYEEAFAKGAEVCILQRKPEKILAGKTVILVEDTIKALQQIAAYKRSQYAIPVVAVTGSVGKTSTKDMIANVLAQKYHVLKTQGNWNNAIGLPLTILQLQNHTAMVVEMGMNHLGEIRTLTQIAKPTIAVITNVGTSHIGNLKTRENILRAKLEIIEGLQENGVVILNNDNDLLHTWSQQANIPVVTCGIEEKSQYMPTRVQLGEEASQIDIEGTTITIPVAGKPFISNSLCAVAVGKQLGLSMEQIRQGIETFTLSKNRMEKITNQAGVHIIQDAYNANYDSMLAALEYLANLSHTRKIAVLGDMLELGEYATSLHEQIGEAINQKNIDCVITVGEEAKHIAEKVQGKEVYVCKTNEEAVEKLKHILQKGDTVLLKASHGMHFSEIGNVLLSL